eukprot:364212-Chlamydomonas_euryale.AAC.10
MSREKNVRNVRTLAAFRQLRDKSFGTQVSAYQFWDTCAWASPKLCIQRKMNMHRTSSLPNFCTAAQCGHGQEFRWAEQRPLNLNVSAALSA